MSWKANKRVARDFPDLLYLPKERCGWDCTLASLAYGVRRSILNASPDLGAWAARHGLPASARYQELGDDARVLWHGTSRERAEKIAEHGLFHKQGLWTTLNPFVSHGFCRGRSERFGERPHEHVTLFFRGGGLIAVYKGGEAHYASLSEPATRRWKPRSWHRIQFSWQAGEGGAIDFFVRIDGRLVGPTTGRRVEPWPARLYVGIRGTGRPWKGLIDDLRIRPEPLPIPELEPGRRTITVHGDQAVGECYVFWAISNFTSQHMFADARKRPGLGAQRPKMRFANCVRLLAIRRAEEYLEEK